MSVCMLAFICAWVRVCMYLHVRVYLRVRVCERDARATQEIENKDSVVESMEDKETTRGKGVRRRLEWTTQNGKRL